MRRAGGLAAALTAAAVLTSGAMGVRSQGREENGSAIAFEQSARARGLTMTHVNGASPEKYLVETMGSGAAFLDYDADGWVDSFFVDGGSIADPSVAARARHRLFRNEGGGRFTDVTGTSGIRHHGYGMGVCAGDVDNDGRIDLYVTGYGVNVLYRNRGDGTFVEDARAGAAADGLWSTSCAFLDADLDGDLDLFVTNYLDAPKERNPFCGDPARRIRVYCHPLNYPGLPNLLFRNDGTGAFTDVSRDAGLAGHIGNGLGVAVGDYDDDGWPDVFVANDAVPNFLFHNEGQGRFREVALAAGVAVARDGKARAGMGTEFADVDGDGRLDLLVTNHEFETHTLFRNDGGGLFTDVTVERGLVPPTLPLVGFGLVFFDVDHDAALDLAITNGHVIDNTAVFRAGSTHAQRKLLLRNAGRRFVEVGRSAGSGFATEVVGRTLIAGDIDHDGYFDLVVTSNGGAPELLRRTVPECRPALLVQLQGTRANRDGIGARITVTAGGRTQVREVKSGSSYLGQNDLRAHVGLDGARRVDRLNVRWPGGATETTVGIEADQIVTVTEGRGVTARRPLR